MVPPALHWVQRQTHSGNLSLVRDIPAVSKKKKKRRKKKGKEKKNITLLMTQQNHVCCFKKGGACLSLHKILPLAEALFFKL